MTDPLTERILRVVQDSETKTMDAAHIRLQFVSHMNYSIKEVNDALDECVEQGALIKENGGYRHPDV